MGQVELIRTFISLRISNSEFYSTGLFNLNIKHNGKPLHDRERLVRQSLEDISKASLDVSGCPFLGIFGGLWRFVGVFRDLWGSFQFSCKIRVSRFYMQDETFQFSHAR